MPAVFKDMHRSYRSKDGDAYVTSWNRTRENSYPVTWTHLYQNKVKASSYSIFKYGNMSEEEIKENKLFDYPEIKNNDQNPILGFTATDTDIDAVQDHLIKIKNKLKDSGNEYFHISMLEKMGFIDRATDLAYEILNQQKKGQANE